MIAYNTTALDNLAIQQEVQKAYDNNCVTREEQEAVKKQYAVNLYRPNVFIRIALFIATCIIASFSLGLFSLVLLAAGNGGDDAFGGICIFFSFFTYAALEFMVQRFRHYKSGVDDALRWISGSFLISGVNIIGHVSLLANAVLVLLITIYFLLRFPNRIVSIIACLALFAVVFLTVSRMGAIAKASAPFILMLVSALVYILAHSKTVQQLKYYRRCITMISITALVCFYFSANYFIVREAGNIMFDLHLPEGQGIPFGWLFWALTVIVPFAYIIAGLRKKDVVLLRTGLLLVGFTVFTLRYYYGILPIETAMVIAGCILIGIALSFIQYLKQPRHGFTYLPSTDRSIADKLNVEGLIIAQTFTPQIPVVTNTPGFGGGTGGGGGASGQF